MSLKRILFIGHNIGLGGAERSMAEIIQCLSRMDDYEVSCVLPENGNYNSVYLKLLPNIKIYKCPLVRWEKDGTVQNRVKDIIIFVKQVVRYYKQTKSIINKTQPTFIITNTSVIPQFALVAFFMRIPHCWYVREAIKEQFSWNFILGEKLSLRLIGCLSQVVYTNSHYITSYCGKYISHKKINYVRQAVNITLFCNRRYKQEQSLNIIRLINVGRIDPSKGQMDIIQALKILNDRNYKCHLTLVGESDTPYGIYLKKIAPPNVNFVGQTSNVSEYYAHSDIFIMSSPTEAFGRVTIEAMKNKLPVIASDGGSGPELIRDGYNGFLYHQGDSLDLAVKILNCRSFNIKGMGENAYKYANENYNSTNMMYDFLNPIIKEQFCLQSSNKDNSI